MGMVDSFMTSTNKGYVQYVLYTPQKKFDDKEEIGIQQIYAKNIHQSKKLILQLIYQQKELEWRINGLF